MTFVIELTWSIRPPEARQQTYAMLDMLLVTAEEQFLFTADHEYKARALLRSDSSAAAFIRAQLETSRIAYTAKIHAVPSLPSTFPPNENERKGAVQ